MVKIQQAAATVHLSGLESEVVLEEDREKERRAIQTKEYSVIELRYRNCFPHVKVGFVEILSLA